MSSLTTQFNKKPIVYTVWLKKKTHKCSSEKFRVTIYYFCSELHYRKKSTKFKNLVVTVIILNRTMIQEFSVIIVNTFSFQLLLWQRQTWFYKPFQVPSYSGKVLTVSPRLFLLLILRSKWQNQALSLI